MYHCLNRATPSRNCFISTPDKCTTHNFVLMEICLQGSKQLGPRHKKELLW